MQPVVNTQKVVRWVDECECVLLFRLFFLRFSYLFYLYIPFVRITKLSPNTHLPLASGLLQEITLAVALGRPDPDPWPFWRWIIRRSGRLQWCAGDGRFCADNINIFIGNYMSTLLTSSLCESVKTNKNVNKFKERGVAMLLEIGATPTVLRVVHPLSLRWVRCQMMMRVVKTLKTLHNRGSYV